MKERFTPGQRRTLLLCALSYTVAYLGRMNLSASLPGVQAALQLSETQAGVFQTVTALAGVATGALSDVAGWPGVYSLWMIVSLAGVGFAALSIAGGKRLRAGE